MKAKQSETVAARSRNVIKSHNLVEPKGCTSDHWDVPVCTAKLPAPAPAVKKTASRTVPIWAQTAGQTAPRPVPITSHNSSGYNYEQPPIAPQMAYHNQIGPNSSRWYGMPSTTSMFPPSSIDMSQFYLSPFSNMLPPSTSDMNQLYFPPVSNVIPTPGTTQGYIPSTSNICPTLTDMYSHLTSNTFPTTANGIKQGQPPSSGPRSAVMQPEPQIPGGALEDYQMQLMLLEQQNKRRLMMARQEQNVASAPLAGVAEVSQKPKPKPSAQGTALDDYERQLMLLEQQNKSRLAMARQVKAAALNKMTRTEEAKASSPSSRLQAPLMPSILNSKVSKLNQDAIWQNSIKYEAAPTTIAAPSIDAAAAHPPSFQQRSTRVNPAFQEVCAGKIPDVFHRFQDELWQIGNTGPEKSQALDNAANGINWIMAHPHSDAGVEFETVQLQHMVKSLRTLLAPIPLDNVQSLSKRRMPHEGGSYCQSAYDPFYNTLPPVIGNAQITAPPVPARPEQSDTQQCDLLKEVLTWAPPPPPAAYVRPLTTTQPSIAQPSSASKQIIDRCIETLLDMGFEPRSRVEAIAASADGDFHTAMDLLEEDDRAKNRIRKGKDKADPNADLSVPGGWGEWDGWDVGNSEEDGGDSAVEGLD